LFASLSYLTWIEIIMTPLRGHANGQKRMIFSSQAHHKHMVSNRRERPAFTLFRPGAHRGRTAHELAFHLPYFQSPLALLFF